MSKYYHLASHARFALRTNTDLQYLLVAQWLRECPPPSDMYPEEVKNKLGAFIYERVAEAYPASLVKQFIERWADAAKINTEEVMQEYESCHVVSRNPNTIDFEELHPARRRTFKYGLLYCDTSCAACQREALRREWTRNIGGLLAMVEAYDKYQSEADPTEVEGLV